MTIQKTENSQLAGTYRDSNAVNSRLEWAQQNANLVSPATSVGALPEGCSIALTMVLVDKSDTYNLQGKFGLSKTAIQKIGHAVGVSWDPRLSGRVDDGSDAYYCRWRAVGTYRAFDGQVQTILAEKELDLRDGSPTCVGLESQQARNNKSADGQIREMRMHIQQHAETKAQLRAIRSLGLKTAYTGEELDKPFVAARIMFTGQTKDPALRREFARMTAGAFLGGQAALYGAPPARGVHDDGLGSLPPPPVGTNLDSAEWDMDTGERVGEPVGERVPAEPVRAPQKAASPQAERDPGGDRKSEQKPAQTAPGAQSGAVQHVIPGGNSKGTPLDKASDRDLEYWGGRLAKDLNEGTSRDEKRDSELHAAIMVELGKRQSNGGRY